MVIKLQVIKRVRVFWRNPRQRARSSPTQKGLSAMTINMRLKQCYRNSPRTSVTRDVKEKQGSYWDSPMKRCYEDRHAGLEPEMFEKNKVVMGILPYFCENISGCNTRSYFQKKGEKKGDPKKWRYDRRCVWKQRTKKMRWGESGDVYENKWVIENNRRCCWK